MYGFLLIDKPSGITSAECVSRIKKILNLNNVGHCGTLDPLATGLLIVCTGKFTKQIPEIQRQKKTYTGKFLKEVLK